MWPFDSLFAKRMTRNDAQSLAEDEGAKSSGRPVVEIISDLTRPASLSRPAPLIDELLATPAQAGSELVKTLVGFMTGHHPHSYMQSRQRNWSGFRAVLNAIHEVKPANAVKPLGELVNKWAGSSIVEKKEIADRAFKLIEHLQRESSKAVQSIPSTKKKPSAQPAVSRSPIKFKIIHDAEFGIGFEYPETWKLTKPKAVGGISGSTRFLIFGANNILIAYNTQLA